MALLSLNLPVIGQQSATEDQKTRDALAAIQTAVNGNLDEANVPNLAAAFTTYKSVASGGAVVGPGPVLNTYLLGLTGNGVATNVGAGAAVASAPFALYLDPADWAANARTTKLRLRATLIANGTAPAANFTVALNQVSAFAGGAGVTPFVSTVGSNIVGSAITFTAPAANAGLVANSGDFNVPAATWYVVTILPSVALATNATVAIVCHLQARQV